jgi:hypothetical protein
MTDKDLTWAMAKAKDWKNYLPPTRPSTSELVVIEKYIIQQIKKNPHKKFKAAILGCTIEFRNLLHKYCMNVTCIDISEVHYKILSKQKMVYKGSEKLIIMDWRKILSDLKYDIVLGDLVFNMLNTSDRNLLLKNVRDILTKEIMLILRYLYKGVMFY